MSESASMKSETEYQKKNFATDLDCNSPSIHDPTLYAAQDVFELDEHYDIPLYEVKTRKEIHICIDFEYSLLDDFLSEWMKKKDELTKGKITKEEYFEWKINWPHND